MQKKLKKKKIKKLGGIWKEKKKKIKFLKKKNKKM